MDNTITDLSILQPYLRNLIAVRCGNEVIADGLECPNCGALETYKIKSDPNNTEKWVFVIRAFRFDDASHCTNCDQWFVC